MSQEDKSTISNGSNGESENLEKFLAPNSSEWKLLELPEDDKDNEEKKKTVLKNNEKIRDVLLSSLQMPNLAALAGSGTSLGEVGGPSMGDLWEKVTNTKHTYWYKNEEEEEELEIDPKDIIEKVNYDSNEKNIEALLTQCEAYLRVEKGNKSIEGFVTEAKKIILSECSSFFNNDNLDGHRTFLHRLSKRRVRDPRLKIFTTNYDLCFEIAASFQGLIILDGFSFITPRRYDPNYFNYDIVKRTNSQDKTTNYLEGVFQLFKLHGSVNWERNGSEIIENNDPDPQKACIIYPAHGKYQQSYIQPHLELFSRYLSLLREPNTCLIITGFGFNDDHLAEPIVSAIDTNPHLKVIVADKYAEKQIEDDQVRPYWDKLKEKALSGEDIWFINASFQKFAQMIPDLKALTSAQQLERAIKDIKS